MARAQAETHVSINGVEEAKKKLEELSKQFDILTAAKVKALAQSNKPLADEINVEMKRNKKKANQYKKQLLDVENVLKNINKVSLKDLRAAKAELSRRIQTMNRDSIEYLETQQKIVKIEKELASTRGSGQSKSKGIGAIDVFAGNMLTKIVSGIGKVINKGREWIKQGIEIASKAEGIKTAFDKLNNPNLLKNLRKETKNTVNDLTLMQSAVKAEHFKIPVDQLGNLLKFAQQRAQETRESVEYMTSSIINGIGRKSPLILDNLGISAVRLRGEMKKTGDFTSAAMKIVKEELEKQGTLALTSSDLATQSSVKWENAQLRVGNAFKGISNWWHKLSGNIADAVSDMVGDSKTATQTFDDQIQKVSELEVNIVPLVKRYEELKSKSSLTTTEQAELNRVMNSIKNTIPGVVTEFDHYTGILSINTDKVYEYIAAEKARLRFIHRDAIKETKDIIAEKEKEKAYLEKLYKDGGKHGSTGGFGLMGGGTSSFKPFSDVEKKAIEDQISELGQDLYGANEELKRITGTLLDDQVETSKKKIEHQNKFNSMNKAQLAQWIKDEKEFSDEAKKIYAQRFATAGGSDDNKPTGSWNPEKELDFLKKKTELKEKLLAGEIDTQEEYAQQLLELEIATYENRIKLASDKEDELLKLRDTLADKQYQQKKNETARYEALLSASREGTPKDNTKQLYENASADHEKALKKLGLFHKKRELMSEDEKAALLNLERIYAGKLQTIYTDKLVRDAKQNQDEIKRKQSALKQEHNAEYQAADTFEKKKELLRQHYGEKEADRVHSERQADSMLKKHYQKAEEDQLRADLNKQLEIHKKMMAELKAVHDKGFAIGDISPEEVARIQAIIDDLNAQLAALREGVPGNDRDMSVRVDVLGFSADDWTSFFENLEQGRMGLEGWSMALGLVGDAFGQISALMGALEQREMKNFQRNQNKKKKELDKQRKAGLMSETQYNEAVQRIDTDTEAKREQLQRKQAIREKALGVFQALVNTALGVTAALTVAPPWGIALAATIGALGAAQVATILATPLPGAEEGGEIDVVRSQDGRRFSAKSDPKHRGFVDTPTVITGEDGSEYIIPREGVENPTIRPVIDIIEKARRSGSLNTIDLSAEVITPVRGLAAGGYADTHDPQTIYNNTEQRRQDPDHIAEMMLAAVKEQNAINKELRDAIKGGLNVSMVGKNGLLGKVKELIGIMNNSRG